MPEWDVWRPVLFFDTTGSEFFVTYKKIRFLGFFDADDVVAGISPSATSTSHEFFCMWLLDYYAVEKKRRNGAMHDYPDITTFVRLYGGDHDE